MFLNIIKYKALKKGVAEAILKASDQVISAEIKTIGIIIDKKDFSDIMPLKKALLKKGFSKEQLSFLVYNHDKVAIVGKETWIGSADFTSSGVLKNDEVASFLEKQFDLLINYYDIESLVLLWASSHSKAKLKVGFASVKTHINHFSIELTTDKYSEYIDELFKYLQLFKKK